MTGLVCVCMISYIMQIMAAKKIYTAQIVNILEKLLIEQHSLLQSLGKQLLTSIINHDSDTIRSSLLIYADQVFILAKRGYTIPAHIQWVSLTIPQQIISGLGILDKQMLAPDEQYYLQAVADPTNLKLSSLYTIDEMPEHVLLNIGLGILDNEHNYWGHLDVRVSISAIENYIRNKLTIKSNEFDFKLVGSNLLHPRVLLNKSGLCLGFIQYSTYRLIILFICYFMLTCWLRFYRIYLNQAQSLNQSLQQIKLLTTNINIYKLAAETQYKYGMLAVSKDRENLELLDPQNLLTDMQAVNAELAMIRQIHVNVICDDKIRLQIRANKLRLMQILSGMLYEIIMQLPVSSTVTIQLSVIKAQHNLHKFIFKFIDNGFYTQLLDRFTQCSNADVRTKGWGNIEHLIDIEHGSLEYVHTPYSGNIISLTVIRDTTNNIVSLKNYYSEL